MPVNSSCLGLLYFGKVLVILLILLLLIHLFIFSISSWFSLGRVYIPKNLSISFIYFVGICLLLVVSEDSLYLCDVPCSFSFFAFQIKKIHNLSSLFFPWWVWLRICQFFFNLLREPAFNFINLHYCFFHFFSIYFCSDLISSFFLLILFIFFFLFQLL